MAKFNLKKQSKRQPARQRYKIQKKIRQHNKKKRREAKKNPKGHKKQIIEIPNICPFKEDILKEVEAVKQHKEAERQKQREAAKAERQKKLSEKKLTNATGLEALVANAESRGKLHDTFTPDTTEKSFETHKENSLKAYYKEFKKVIEAADVILEVVDARDPLGTRCVQVEQAVKEMAGNKKLVLVLNKADLVPRDVLSKWLNFLRKSVPAVPFKASTQGQKNKLGQRKMMASHKALQGSASVGAELLMSLLGNYCRNKNIKTSIRVGIVGLPNVGKSSIINSLKRSRACNVGATPGVTRAVQEVQLDSKIKLLDSPGIVFAAGSDSSASLRNAVRISSLADPITPANAILQRVSKQQMMEMYNVVEYSTPEEFFKLKATRTGKFKKGGVPDMEAAARGLLEDWNSGKIRYYTVPPEEVHQEISSAIVTGLGEDFKVENFEILESNVLMEIEKEKLPTKVETLVESLGPVDTEKMEEDCDNDQLLNKNINVKDVKKGKKSKAESEKADPEMALEGNQKLNQVRKLQFKKEKKQRNRREKVAKQLSAGLENFSITADQTKNDDDYDFDRDFKMD